MNFSLSDLTYKNTKNNILTIHDPVSKLTSKKKKKRRRSCNHQQKKCSSEIYLRDARVGKIQKAAKQRLSVVGADGRRRVGEQVVVEHALPEKLVKEPGGVCRAQGASEPGMLDGDIHTDNRQVGSYLLRRRCPCLLRCPARLEAKGSDVSSVREPEEWNVSGELFCFPRRPTLFIHESQKREALAPIPLEWHYLMVVWSPSADSEGGGVVRGALRMEVLMDGPGGAR